MPSQKTANADNASVSNEQPAAATATALATTAPGAVQEQQGAIVNISPELRDKLTAELQKALHSIETGFDVLTKPGDIEKTGVTFSVVDALLIPDFIDKRTGEESEKCIFRLQYDDGRVVTVMQSAARPRKVIAQAFESAMQLGVRLTMGPYKFVRKGVGQIQDAVIFEQQANFRVTQR